MPTAGDTPGRCELSADGSRADVYFHQASAVYSQGPQFHPTLKNAEGSGETPGASPVVNLKLKHDWPGSGVRKAGAARGAASRRLRPRDWEGGEPDVGHGV